MLNSTFVHAAALLLAGTTLSVAQERIASFGGSGSTGIRKIVTDASGNIYVAGATGASDLPVKNAAQPQFGDAAILRSSDAGQTWVKVAGPADPPLVLVPDPSNSRVLFAGTIGGILKSADAGATWRNVYAIERSYPGIENLVIDSANPAQLAASIPQKGLVVSRDGGETWTSTSFDCSDSRCYSSLFGGPSVIATATLISRDWGLTAKPLLTGASLTALAFHPTRPGRIYAASSAGVRGFLRVSPDYGESWTELSVPATTFSAIYSMAVHTAPLETILAATIEGLWRSTNDGASWERVAGASADLPIRSPPILALPPSCSGGGLFAVVSAGVTRSTDGGASWTTLPAPARPTGISAGGCTLYALRRTSTDAFVSKLDANGAPQWTTYLGGLNEDSASSLAVDRNGNVYVAGTTSSEDFPSATGHGATGKPVGFVTRFSPGGNIEWTAPLGGEPGGSAIALALDRGGNAYLAMQSRHLTVLSPDGRVVLSTLLTIDATRLLTATALVITDSGEAIIAAYSPSSETDPQPLAALIRVNRAGMVSEVYRQMDSVPSAMTTAPDGSIWTVSTANHFYWPGFDRAPCSDANVSDTRGARVEQFDPVTLKRRAYIVVGAGCEVAASEVHVGADGIVTLALASGLGFPLKSPVLGAPPGCPGRDPAGSIVTRITTGGQPLFATYVGCTDPPALAVAPDGRILTTSSDPTGAGILELNPSPAAALSLDRIGNALSGDAGGVAPGGLYALDVAGMDAEWRDLGLNAESLPHSLVGVEVTFDGIPAHILQTDLGRAIVVAPAALESPVTIQVSFHGEVSNRVVMPVPPQRPGLLTRAFPNLPAGTVDGNVRNQDGTLNAPDNPAARGSTIELFLTGLPDGPAWSTWNNDFRRPDSVSFIEGFVSGLKKMLVIVPQQLDVDSESGAAIAVTAQSPLTPLRVRIYSNRVNVYVK